MGSSPRGRGKLHVRDREPGYCRLIPARAGKTIKFVLAIVVAPAHPRAGGENERRPFAKSLPAGSSPRGRGKPEIALDEARTEGLIPARAGKTGPPARRPRPPAAHPRAGGENRFAGYIKRTAKGSSPRGRGKRAGRARSCLAGRLIPARAGKTVCILCARCRGWAHPRAGGENTCGLARADIVEGSSPRGRGKHAALLEGHVAVRLIPARAGKTEVKREHREYPKAHPRAGGENDGRGGSNGGSEGSSPRGRGKLG